MSDPNLPWVLLLAPLIAAVLNTTLFRKVGVVAAAISVISVLLTLLATIRLMGVENHDYSGIAFTPFHWIPAIGDFQVTITPMIDKLSVGMMFIVTFVGTLVHIFSLGYMKDDSRKSAYFAGLSIFMFSMTGIVLADNFVSMFIFWELVGVSSYVLIGHYFDKNSAAEASKKAFLVNRIGDFGFMIGILILWTMTGTIMFGAMEENLGALTPGLATVATLLIFLGAVGKSAQMPLHVWLPDAMEGPTPVSALIHAATMVAAGVFMLVRVMFLLEIDGSQAGTIIAWIGGVTAAFAALCAVQQDDIKKILAYSTLSQLGYMVMAVGLTGGHEAMFHLYTHAFFKALLFLGAGAVIYAAHHEQDIWKMGGLIKKMPITFWTFAIGTAALIAVPGTSGFWSKEGILHVAEKENPALMVLGICVAVLTAFYMTRLVIVAFLGKPRTESADHAKEVPPIMWVPLTLLAVLSLFSAYDGFSEPLMAYVEHHGPAAAESAGHHGESGPSGESGHGHDHKSHGYGLMITSIIAMLIGVVGAVLLYRGRDKDPINIGILAKKFYLDEIYLGFVRWLQDLPGYILHAIDELLINGLIVTGSAKLTEGVGRVLRRVQTGHLQTYAGIFAVGVVILLWLILGR
ncbi:MAG: NADH-quinone oxidoreductase subunit L [Verrucomicrobiota bacterium]